MKIAVLSDIHGNLPALQAVITDVNLWSPDYVFINGDTVNRGPWPAECLSLLQSQPKHQGWRSTMGNHEAYVLELHDNGEPADELEALIGKHTAWTLHQVQEYLPFIRSFAQVLEAAAPDESLLRMAHASIYSNRAGIFPASLEDEIRAKMGVAPAAFATGHTHRPFVRWVDPTLVVNVGSVGLPFDGDPRASYARFSWSANCWKANIIRVRYDREAAEAGFLQTGYIDQGGPLVPIVLRELQLSRPIVYAWDKQYRPEVMNHKIDVYQSVSKLLATYGQGGE